MIGRNDPCWCNSGKKFKKCHWPELPTSTSSSPEDLAREYQKKHGIILKTPQQISKIKAACKISSDILAELMEKTRPGVTTKELDDLSRKLHQKMHAVPAALDYGSPPFPGSICTSVNDMVCHGIPNDIPLQEGDIINIDVASIKDGYYGDCSCMVCLGPIDEDKKRAVLGAYEGLMNAIATLKPQSLLSEIGEQIDQAARKYSCSSVEQFVGHGVGLGFHERPEILFYPNNNHLPLAPGMTFTIEPMINAGKKQAVIDPINQWEARTVDGMPSAQFEHTILITPEGHELLTHWKFEADSLL